MGTDPDTVGGILVVGASRSGTTVLGRMLGQHPAVRTFPELHYFNRLCRLPKNHRLTSEQSRELTARLERIIKLGYYRAEFSREEVATPAKSRRVERTDHCPTAGELYVQMLSRACAETSHAYFCDHTPANLYYLDRLPGSLPLRIVALVRDPRDVLVSQKLRWKRRRQSGNQVPRVEVLRFFINYHPILMARLWRRAARETQRIRERNDVLVVKFEDLVEKPEATMRSVCSFLRISYDREMLSVPAIGSSVVSDFRAQTGLDSSAVGRWQSGLLRQGELAMVERICREELSQFGYRESGARLGILALIRLSLTLLLRLPLVLLLNRTSLGAPVSTGLRRL